jgi:hypothetical protein
MRKTLKEILMRLLNGRNNLGEYIPHSTNEKKEVANRTAVYYFRNVIH